MKIKNNTIKLFFDSLMIFGILFYAPLIYQIISFARTAIWEKIPLMTFIPTPIKTSIYIMEWIGIKKLILTILNIDSWIFFIFIGTYICNFAFTNRPED